MYLLKLKCYAISLEFFYRQHGLENIYLLWSYFGCYGTFMGHSIHIVIVFTFLTLSPTDIHNYINVYRAR